MHYKQQAALSILLAIFLPNLANSAPSKVTFEPIGPLIQSSQFPGERRSDNVSPHAASGCQIANDRWILLFYTRGYRVVDEERSVLYQIREGKPDGKVLREGMLAPSDAFGSPNQILIHGHAVVWGVPMGAQADGQPLPNANHFCAKWYTKEVTVTPGNVRAKVHGMWVEWMQFKYDPECEDIRIVQPITKANCGHTPLAGPVRLDPKGMTWVDLCSAHAPGANLEVVKAASIQPVKYAWDSETGRYRITDKGSAWETGVPVFEGTMARAGKGWVSIARVRGGKGLVATHSDDPFSCAGNPRHLGQGTVGSMQKMVFRCADGKLRVFSGVGGRSVAWSWELDPKILSLSNQTLVWNADKLDVPYEAGSGRVIDVYTLLPHAGGREQYLLYGFSPKALDYPYTGKLVGESAKDAAGVYYAKLIYPHDYPGEWQFGD